MTKNAKPSGDKDVSGTTASQHFENVKLAVRLLDSVNLPLRDLVRFQGEFAGYIVEAIESVDLAKVPLVVIRDPKARDTTVRVNEKVFQRLSTVAKDRRTSVNVLVNTAVAHWLQTRQRRDVVRFRS